MANKTSASKLAADGDRVIEALRSITLKNHLSASSVFSLFAIKPPFIPPTDDNYFLNAALHTPRTYLGGRELQPGSLNWIGTMDNVFVVTSIPRDKSEINVRVIARELPSNANNYAFRRFVNYEDDDSQAFNSGIIGSPNVLGSVKLHWNSSISTSIEFVLQEDYSSAVLSTLKFPHPLLYTTLDSNYGDLQKTQLSNEHFTAMVESFGLGIERTAFQTEEVDSVKFMIGLACIMAILCYTPADASKLPSLQFNTDLLSRAGFTRVKELTTRGQAQPQVPTLRMIDLLRAEYGLFRPEGLEAEQVRQIYSKVNDMKEKDDARRRDDHEPEKRKKRYEGGGGGSAPGVPGKILIPSLPTDEDIQFGEKLFKAQYEDTKNTPEPAPDSYLTSPQLVAKSFSKQSRLSEEDIKQILSELQASTKQSQLSISSEAQAVFDLLEPSSTIGV